MMRSLRARLTFAYASVFAVALWIVVLLGTRLEFEALAHSTLAATETSVRLAHAVIAQRRGASQRDIEGQIMINASHEGVVIRIPPPGRRVRPNPEDGPRNLENFSMSSLLGLRPHLVRVGSDVVFIAPDLVRLRPVLNLCLETLIVGMLLAAALAWAIARWISGYAIRPLLTVTDELRRFAGGDFTPRPVLTSDRAELGALIEAYNGATAKVAAAFEERQSVEDHMRRFVADAGHELRTPLTAIDGYLQILRKARPDDVDVRERALTTLQAQTARIRALVERLMVLARLERPDHGRHDDVDVAAIAADAIAGVTSARGGHVTLDASAVPPAVADVADVHEALANLIDNAVKYGAGSDVRVSVSNEDGFVVVRVADGGPGIPEAERVRIFERFFRGDERGSVEGSGLGLAIVERAVARCGGRVVLERADPGATTFAVYLPAAGAHVRDASPLQV